MRALFRAFRAHRVRYLVISGQASILYGAAYFSQDLDLWVEPTGLNLRRWLRALAALRARVHKLTPPLTPALLRRGHGFHFLVPQRGESPLYLDIMGQPPRVRGFGRALRRAERVHTPWGRLPVVGIEDLVAIKKTNRPADYEVITHLALIRLDRERRPAPGLLRWALQHIFRVEDLWETVQRFGARLTPRILAADAAANRLHRVWTRGQAPTAVDLSRAAAVLGRRAQALQDLGRAYWLPRIEELRQLRRAGLLLPEGLSVSELL